ncbi:hypothetical protein GLX_15290 [Komagataeibacter medellinensis NBRC 3288]|uniref:Uncharacterized protein n=2 Tax=Komagataeibacter medellinensis TaxID=1177712 RepID=G2I744_KOMMN|nr:hypothetical protein GLX_15290 [Komagataeibacter medellinensis NBRC 3288]
MPDETPMYLVPGEVSDEQASEVATVIALNTSKKIGVHQALEAIGTPIQPCTDVETVGVYYEVNLGYYGAPSVWKPRVSATSSKHLPCRDITPLVRRIDMAAQVTVRDMEIARLKENALPDEMTPDIEAALGLICFQAAPYANAFRAAGAKIPHKAEAEQAYVIFKLLKGVLKLGDFEKASKALHDQAVASLGKDTAG